MKKLLALLLALCMAFSLCACGSDPSTSAPSDQPASALSYDRTPPAASDEPSTNGEIVNTPAADAATANSPADHTPAEATKPAETPEQPSNPSELIEMTSPELIVPDVQGPDPALVTPSHPEGLIIMTTSAEGSFSGSTNITISSLDVDTGNIQTISKFTFGIFRSADAVITHYNSPEGSGGSAMGGGYYATRREWFDDDYDRMAVTWMDNVSAESHAGWLDTNGEFFDVTVALGLEAKSDFDPPTKHDAIGFSEDGYFIYRNLIGSGSNATLEFCHVPLDNLSADAVETGIRLVGAGEEFQYKNRDLRFSDYDSASGRLLLNTSTSISRLCTSPDDAGETYVPGDSRLSWNGVFSPDGSLVAFMSKQKGGGVVDIYTVSIGGGDPVKINTDSIDLAIPDACEKGRYDSGAPCSILIGWQ